MTDKKKNIQETAILMLATTVLLLFFCGVFYKDAQQVIKIKANGAKIAATVEDCNSEYVLRSSPDYDNPTTYGETIYHIKINYTYNDKKYEKKFTSDSSYYIYSKMNIIVDKDNPNNWCFPKGDADFTFYVFFWILIGELILHSIMLIVEYIKYEKELSNRKEEKS